MSEYNLTIPNITTTKIPTIEEVQIARNIVKVQFEEYFPGRGDIVLILVAIFAGKFAKGKVSTMRTETIFNDNNEIDSIKVDGDIVYQK